MTNLENDHRILKIVIVCLIDSQLFLYSIEHVMCTKKQCDISKEIRERDNIYKAKRNRVSIKSHLQEVILLTVQKKFLYKVHDSKMFIILYDNFYENYSECIQIEKSERNDYR